jgi:hypothetical protein
MLTQAGFTQVADRGPTGVNSSPTTEGRYFFARKP